MKREMGYFFIFCVPLHCNCVGYATRRPTVAYTKWSLLRGYASIEGNTELIEKYTVIGNSGCFMSIAKGNKMTSENWHCCKITFYHKAHRVNIFLFHSFWSNVSLGASFLHPRQYQDYLVKELPETSSKRVALHRVYRFSSHPLFLHRPFNRNPRVAISEEICHSKENCLFITEICKYQRWSVFRRQCSYGEPYLKAK